MVEACPALRRPRSDVDRTAKTSPTGTPNISRCETMQMWNLSSEMWHSETAGGHRQNQARIGRDCGRGQGERAGRRTGGTREETRRREGGREGGRERGRRGKSEGRGPVSSGPSRGPSGSYPLPCTTPRTCPPHISLSPRPSSMREPAPAAPAPSRQRTARGGQCARAAGRAAGAEKVREPTAVTER